MESRVISAQLLSLNPGANIASKNGDLEQKRFYNRKTNSAAF
jgi:hypothetical protein